MDNFKRYGLIFTLSAMLVSASFADFRFGGELTAGLTSAKLFSTETSRYLEPFTNAFSAIRLSAFVGWDSGNTASKIAFGFEQHLGIHPVSLASIEHLPLILSCPTRAYVRFGSSRMALDVLTGIDNQFVILGSQKYPAYATHDWYGNIIQAYDAAPGGYALGLELGLRLVLRHFYLTTIASIPISNDYIFPGMIRLGCGVTF